MDIKKKYKKNKCPNCGEYCISYWQKMKLMDYRYSYDCNKCGRTIKLPGWHILVYLSEIIMMIFIMGKLDLNTWESIIFGLLVFLFISFIQLRFIPIKG